MFEPRNKTKGPGRKRKPIDTLQSNEMLKLLFLSLVILVIFGFCNLLKR
jgi:hypothetical protein